MTDQRAKTLPIAVDLDKTLILSDTLIEAVVSVFLRNPLNLLLACLALFAGRPAFKRAVFARSHIDIDALPVREKLIEHLQVERTKGREIILVTATTQSVADSVAARFDGLFSSAFGTNDDINLKGAHKARFLQAHYPEGFVYAGDSAADLKVWRHAAGAILAGASGATQRKVEKLGTPVEAIFSNQRRGLRAWRKALRVHQWSKNLLIFVALFLSGQFAQPMAWMAPIVGFFVLSVAASGTYILNDLLDLSSDRRHRTKRDRPFAAGHLNPLIGLMAAIIMIPGAIAVGFGLSAPFGFGLLVYLAMTLSYSLGLKRVAMLDVFLIASLFTIRVVLGALAVQSELSEWLLTFCMFFFLSLAFAKRHVEVAAAEAGQAIRGRGYGGDDAPLTLVFGVASGSAAILILVLYLVEDAFPSQLYALPETLWAAPILIMLWIMRVWTLAHRGELDDDPVAFAVKDRVSLLMGVGLVGAFAAAVLAFPS